VREDILDALAYRGQGNGGREMRKYASSRSPPLLSVSPLPVPLSLQVLVEKSLIGWKEFELEVMRDLADNVVIVCSIEVGDWVDVRY